MVMIGAAMLWVGWFGFNGGSALGANGGAGMAIAVTHISAATACLVWITIEWIKFGKPSLVGIATGAIAGLATITPGSGFVGSAGALVYGALAGIVCYSMINVVRLGEIDISLDVFAVHGVGGILGILLRPSLPTRASAAQDWRRVCQETHCAPLCGLASRVTSLLKLFSPLSAFG